LPHAHCVPLRIAEDGNRKVAVSVGRRDDLAAVGDDGVELLVDALDEDVGPDAGVARNPLVRDKVADDVACAVFEARVGAINVHPPFENRSVERRRTLRIVHRNPQIRDAVDAEDPGHTAILPPDL